MLRRVSCAQDGSEVYAPRQRAGSSFVSLLVRMQLGQTTTSELLQAAETSQENVQGVAEVRNISHLLREPHARQCLRHRVKHLSQTTRTKSPYTSTTSLKKIRRIIVRDCPCSRSLTIKMREIVIHSHALKITNRFAIARGGRSTSHGRRQSKVPLRRWNMFELCANGLTMCRDRGQARAMQSFRQACATEHTCVARQHLYSNPQI